LSLVNHYDKCAVILSLKAENSHLIYNGKYYERRSANNSLIEAELLASDMANLFSRFAK